MPTYYYNVSNHTYRCSLHKCYTKYPDLSTDLVYYDPDEPYNCVTEYEIEVYKPYLIYLLVLFFGIILIIIGLYSIFKIMTRFGFNIIQNNNYTNIEINNTPELTRNSGSDIKDLVTCLDDNYIYPAYNYRCINNED